MSKSEAYSWAAKRVRAQVLRHVDTAAALGNIAAILAENFANFFWVGFYWVRPGHLLLGPFQGPPACVKLGLDRGVCAAAVRKAGTVVVPDVDRFPGHVACDERSSSEIAVPVFDGTGHVVAVLDVDSESRDDFDDVDVSGLEEICRIVGELYKRGDG